MHPWFVFVTVSPFIDFKSFLLLCAVHAMSQNTNKFFLHVLFFWLGAGQNSNRDIMGAK